MQRDLLLKRYCIPFFSAAGIVLVGGSLVFGLFPAVKFQLLHGVFVLAGGVIGYLTPAEKKSDALGTNALLLLAFDWFITMIFSDWLFPQTFSLTERMMQIMGNNIINGFAIIAGAGLGWYFQIHPPALQFSPPKPAPPAVPRQATPLHLSRIPTQSHWLNTNQQKADSSRPEQDPP